MKKRDKIPKTLLLVLAMFMATSVDGIVAQSRIAVTANPDALQLAMEDAARVAGDTLVLTRGAVYEYSDDASNTVALVIIAEDGDGARPIIRPASGYPAASDNTDRFVRPAANLTFIDVVIELSDAGSGFGLGRAFRLDQTDMAGDTLAFYGSDIFGARFDDQAMIRLEQPGQSVYFEDCIVHTANRIIDVRVDSASAISVVSSTIYNLNDQFLNFNEAAGKAAAIMFDENTFFDIEDEAVNFGVSTNVTFTNNVVVDAALNGDNVVKMEGYDANGTYVITHNTIYNATIAGATNQSEAAYDTEVISSQPGVTYYEDLTFASETSPFDFAYPRDSNTAFGSENFEALGDDEWDLVGTTPLALNVPTSVELTDALESGSLVNHDTLILEREGTYLIDDARNTVHLVIKSAEGTTEAAKIVPKDGDVENMMRLRGSLMLEDVILDGQGIVTEFFLIRDGDDYPVVNLVLENVVMENQVDAEESAIYLRSEDVAEQSIIINNSVFQNLPGRLFRYRDGVTSDSVIITNSTFYNIGERVFRADGSATADKLVMKNNTFYLIGGRILDGDQTPYVSVTDNMIIDAAYDEQENVMTLDSPPDDGFFEFERNNIFNSPGVLSNDEFYPIPYDDDIESVNPGPFFTENITFTSVEGEVDLGYSSNFLAATRADDGGALGDRNWTLTNETVATFSLLHASPFADVDTVDIYMNGELAFDDVSYLASTGFMNAVGTLNITVDLVEHTAADNSSPLFSGTLVLENQKNYFVIAAGDPALSTGDTAFDLYTFDMALQTGAHPDSVSVLAFHASTDAPAVDFTIGDNLIDDFVFSEYAGYISLPEEELNAVLETGDNSAVIAEYVFPLEDEGGNAYLLFAAGFVEPGDGEPGFGLYAADRFGNTFLIEAIPPVEDISTVRTLEDDEYVTISGIVTTPDFGFTIANFYVQDETGGILVSGFSNGIGGAANGSPFAEGDSVTITGYTNTFNDVRELQIEFYEILNEDVELPEPVVLMGEDLTLESQYQGMRVTVKSLSILDNDDWPTGKISTGSGVSVLTDYETGEGDSLIIRIDRDESFYDESPVPPQPMILTGVLTRFRSDVQVMPFFDGEIEAMPSVEGIASIRALEDDEFVAVSGVVTTPDFGFNSANFYIQDETGGILVSGFSAGIGGAAVGSPFAEGDSISITGYTNTFNDVRELQIEFYEILAEGVDLPDPVVVMSSDLTLESQYQGMRVTVENLSLINTNDWPIDKISSGSGVSVQTDYETGEGDSLIIRIDRDESFYDESPVPPQPMVVTGVLTRFRSDVQIMPFYEGEIEMYSSNEGEIGVPERFALKQNYPNPFNPSTQISYDLASNAEVRLEVFNLLGQKIATLVNAAQNAGSYTVSFDASSLASGVYIYRIQAGQFTSTQKMMLMK